MRVTKAVDFDKRGQELDDANKTGYASPRGDSLVIYPQPARLSGETALTVTVGDATSGDDPCSVKLYDAAGRLGESGGGEGMPLPVGQVDWKQPVHCPAFHCRRNAAVMASICLYR